MDKNKEIYDAIEKVIDKQTAFGDLLTADEKQVLIDYGVVHSASIDEVLCKQGEVDRRIFILVMGEVEISEGSNNDQVVLAYLKRGEVFGEISALFNSPRISTVRVTKPSVLLIIPGEAFEKVITGRSELYSAILERYKIRLSETALRSVDLFRQLDNDALIPLIKAASIVSVPNGGVIVSEGEEGDYFYILIRGVARVSNDLGGRSAIDRVDMLRIERNVMLEFIKKQPEVGKRIEMVAQKRREQSSGAEIPDSPEQLQRMVKNIKDVIEKGLEE